MSGGATMPGWVLLAMIVLVLAGLAVYLHNRDR